MLERLIEGSYPRLVVGGGSRGGGGGAGDSLVPSHSPQKRKGGESGFIGQIIGLC